VIKSKTEDGKGTKTSPFGVTKRESYDSSKFYSRKLYGSSVEEVDHAIEMTIPSDVLDTVSLRDSHDMSPIPNGSVHLIVTSPPYNVGKDYDEDLSLNDYRQLLKLVFEEVYRVLVVGGRACVNVANIGRWPYIPIHSYIIQDMLEIGYLMRGEVIWLKAASAGASTAWGS